MPPSARDSEARRHGVAALRAGTARCPAGTSEECVRRAFSRPYLRSVRTRAQGDGVALHSVAFVAAELFRHRVQLGGGLAEPADADAAEAGGEVTSLPGYEPRDTEAQSRRPRQGGRVATHERLLQVGEHAVED